MVNTEQERYERQVKLEEEGSALGIERYYRRLRKRDNLSEDGPCRSMMNRMLPSLVDYIDAERERSKSTRGVEAVGMSLASNIDAETLAFYTMRSIFSTMMLSKQDAPLSHVAAAIGRALEAEINYRAYRDTNARAYKVTATHLATTRSQFRRHKVESAYTYHGVKTINWGTKERTHVGLWLLGLLCDCAPSAVYMAVIKKAGKTVRVIKLTHALIQWVEQGFSACSLLEPVDLPMIVPPMPWEDVRTGGYLTYRGKDEPVIKSMNRNYLEALDQVEMPGVYRAINSVQDTPWRVNTAVLEVAQELWDQGVVIGSSLPCRDELPIPAKPPEWENITSADWKRRDIDSYRQWAGRAAAIHGENQNSFSKRLATQRKLDMADRFSDEEEIYFPHSMDFRGRLYAANAGLCPQGDDLSKALIEFAHGKPLGERGYWWLCVHIANCFGVDKVSLEERYEWTQANMHALLDSGVDPIGGARFWTEADDPFLALAACFELVGYSFVGPEYVSHIPISMDGSCNGLQNFSALLRDPIGGAATNLTPSDEPQDIYTEVMKIVEQEVRQAALEGNSEAIKWDGFICRKLVKQPVMTMPYGATRNGMGKQLEAAAKKLGYTHIEPTEIWKACSWLAGIVYESIGRVVLAARAAMDWLQEVSRLVSSEDLPIRWETPLGLPVLQEYRRTATKRITVHYNGIRTRVTIGQRTKDLDRRRQTNGIAPNFVHSLDATHLMLTVLLGVENGLSHFAMVHDSYACHAADTDLLNACIREMFAEMYSEDLLGKLKEELEEQTGLKLPDLPESGDLDITVVKDSLYFFA